MASEKSGTSWVEFYESYLDIKGSAEGTDFESALCVFHPDSDASAGFSKRSGVFHCFGCDKSWSPQQFLVDHAKLDPQAAHVIVDDYRASHALVEQFDSFTIKMPTNSPRLEGIFKSSQASLSPELPIVKEYLISRGIEYETLVELKIGFLSSHLTYWKRDSLVFPYFYGNKVVGIRYRDIESSKGGEPGAHFAMWGMELLETNPDVVVIVEGETDRIVVHEAIRSLKGIIVLSTPTATFRREWVRELEGVRQVIFIPQGDEPSIKMIKTIRDSLSKLTVLTLRWRRGEIGKDVADWQRYHTKEELCNLIEASILESTRRVLSAEEFAEVANKPRQWLVAGLMARRHVGMIAGAPKAFKTWMLLNLMRTLIQPGSLFCDIPGIVSTIEEPCNTLLIEEEGDIEDLYSRAEMVLGDTEWKKHTFWGHQLGFKWDIPDWIDRISDIIEQNKIDVLFVDPFQRTHNRDENDSGEMGTVWDSVANLIRRHKQLSIVMLHHFNKTGDLSMKFGSFRGSSRTAGEIDFAIFTERRPRTQGLGVKIIIDGRSITSPLNKSGDEILTLDFEPSNGRFSLVD